MPNPIILFVYNRPVHTERTINSLLHNKEAQESELFVFSDGAKNEEGAAQVQAVRKYIKQLKGFKQIHISERDENWGLAKSVIAGVSEVFELYNQAIVLEDDLIFAQNFLTFMNDALEHYEHQKEIFSISGYLYPLQIPKSYTNDVLLLPRASSWGWATWKDRWQQTDWQVADFELFQKDKMAQKAFAEGGKDQLAMLYKQQKGLVDSWAIRWSYAHFKNKAYGLFPSQSKVQNIGADASGTNVENTTRYLTELSNQTFQFPDSLTPNKEIINSLKKFFEPSMLRKAINWLKYGL